MLVAPDGSIFVAEAHNAQFLDQNPPNGIGRISKFAPDGKFIKSFGSYGYGPSQFRGPHSLAMDSRGRLSSPIAAIAASRSSIRTASTSTRGTSSAASAGSTSISNDMLYAIDSESDDNYNPGWRKGLRVGSARTGEVWYLCPSTCRSRRRAWAATARWAKASPSMPPATSTAAKSARSRA